MDKEKTDMLKGLGIAGKKLIVNYWDLALMVAGMYFAGDIAGRIIHPHSGGTKLGLDYFNIQNIISTCFFACSMVGGVAQSGVTVYNDLRSSGYSRFTSAVGGLETATYRGLRNFLGFKCVESDLNGMMQYGLGALAVFDILRYSRLGSRTMQGIEKLGKKYSK